MGKKSINPDFMVKCKSAFVGGMKLKISELGKVITGNTPSKKIKEFWDKDDVGFVKPDIISDEHIVKIKSEDCNEFISNAAISKARIVPKNSIFVTCIGNIGKIGVATDNLAFNQQINAIIPNENVNLDYLCYAIFANKTRLQDIANAPIVPLLNKSQFSEFELEFDMDINTQTRIVHELNTVSNIILKYKQELLLQNELVRARFVEMFGDPVHSEKYGTRKLSSCVAEKSDMVDGPFGSQVNTKVDYIENGEIPVIRTVNVKMMSFSPTDLKYMTREKYETVIRSQVLPGDVILTKVGTIGNVCIFPNAFDEAVLSTTGSCRIRVDNSVVNTQFFAYNLMYLKGKLLEIASAGVQPFLNMNHVKNIDILDVSLEKQKEFADFVKEVDKSRLLNNHSLLLLKSIIF